MYLYMHRNQQRRGNIRTGANDRLLVGRLLLLYRYLYMCYAVVHVFAYLEHRGPGLNMTVYDIPSMNTLSEKSGESRLAKILINNAQ